MAYLVPNEFVTKMIDAGEGQDLHVTRDTVIRAHGPCHPGAGAAFAVTINVATCLVGALLFPVGFCMLYLLGFDLLTGVFTLCPSQCWTAGCTWNGVLRNWWLVFIGNFARRLHRGHVHGHHLHLRLQQGAQCRRHEDPGVIGESHTVGYLGPRRGRHADALHPLA